MAVLVCQRAACSWVHPCLAFPEFVVLNTRTHCSCLWNNWVLAVQGKVAICIVEEACENECCLIPSAHETEYVGGLC